MLQKLGLILLAVVCAAIGVWVALLTLLPDARPVSLAVATVGGETTVAAQPVAVLPTMAAPLGVPVAGIPREAIRDSWGDPRDNGLRPHHGTDIMAAPGTPVLAAAPGTVEKLWTSAAGGTTLYVRSPARQWTYYYAHLSGYAAGLHEGQVVQTGETIAYVGDTGNAGAGNFHLHFGLTHTLPQQRWFEGQDVDPYPYLAGQPAAR